MVVVGWVVTGCIRVHYVWSKLRTRDRVGLGMVDRFVPCIIGWPLGPDLSGKSNSNGNLGKWVSVT